MPRATVGTFLVGTRLVGENSLQFGKPQLQLVPRTFSLTVTSGPSPGPVFTNKPKLILDVGVVPLRVDQIPSLGRAQLQLLGRTYTVQVTQALGLGSPELILQGDAYTFVLSQTLTFAKAELLLLGRPPRRVGIPWLVPTVPETLILTPSPAEASAILTPTVPETLILEPTKVKVG